MQLERVVEGHGNEINDMKVSLGEISIKLNVLVNDHKHVSTKVERILEIISELKEKHYILKDVDIRVIKLDETVKKLNEQMNESTKRIENVEYKTSRWSNLMQIIRHYWPILLALSAVIGTIMEYLYKLDPHK